MANVYFTGRAQNLPQVSTITFANTWAAGDSVSVTRGDKTITVTGGSTMDSPEEYASALKAALTANSSDPTGFPNVDMTINAGGREYGEFFDFSVSVSGAVVTLTSTLSGWPFSISVSETTAGSGTATLATSQSATGNTHFDNNDNWSATPAAGDRLICNLPGGQILHGLNNATLDFDLVISDEFGHIGLPRINRNTPGLPYPEDRQRFLSVPVTASTVSEHYIGREGVTGAIPQSRRYLDFGTNLATEIDLYVYDAGGVTDDGAAVQIAGGWKIVGRFYGGSIDIGTNRDQNTSNIRYITQLSGSRGTPRVRVGASATYEDIAGTIEHHAGSLAMESVCNGSLNSIKQYGGTVLVEPTSQITTIEVLGGYMDYRGTAFTNLTVADGGEFDATKCESCTATNNIELHDGYIYRDPHGVINKTINFNYCKPTDGVLDVRTNTRWAPTLL